MTNKKDTILVFATEAVWNRKSAIITGILLLAYLCNGCGDNRYPDSQPLLPDASPRPTDAATPDTVLADAGAADYSCNPYLWITEYPWNCNGATAYNMTLRPIGSPSAATDCEVDCRQLFSLHVTQMAITAPTSSQPGKLAAPDIHCVQQE